MALYEHIFMVRQDVSGQQVEALVDQFKQIVEQAGGSVPKVETWGLKSLTYRIKKNRKAHFTLMNLDTPAAAIAEVERLERINEDVIRFLTVRVDALEEGPSAMMQKREDRGDRDGRGFGGGRFGDRGPRRDFGDRPRPPRREESAPASSKPEAGATDAAPAKAETAGAE